MMWSLKTGILLAISAVLIWVVVVFAGVILITTFGAICGWIIRFTPLNDMIMNALASFGVTGLTLPEFGAMIGFIAGFMGHIVHTGRGAD